MKILVTAGNTQTPIDQVRCITNIFSGRTGTSVALEAHQRGHDVCLLTSHPEVVAELSNGPLGSRWRARPYRTFAELHHLMEQEIPDGDFDAVIHVAAVSDYALAGTYALPAGVSFDAATQTWNSTQLPTRLADATAGKVKSNHQELWLRLTPTPKLVDFIREPWGFRGVLVKFKLEVGVSESDLMSSAANSCRHSQADFIVANTLEGMQEWTLLGDRTEKFVRVARTEMPSQLLNRVEAQRAATT